MSFKDRSCTCKERYEDPNSASIALGLSRKKFDDPSLIWYPCTFCGGYHIGHPMNGEDSKPVRRQKQYRYRQLARLLVALGKKRDPLFLERVHDKDLSLS